MSGRSVSVYTNMTASHDYLCTPIQNGHDFVNYLSNDLKQSCFQITLKTIKCQKLRKLREKFM